MVPVESLCLIPINPVYTLAPNRVLILEYPQTLKEVLT